MNAFPVVPSHMCIRYSRTPRAINTFLVDKQIKQKSNWLKIILMNQMFISKYLNPRIFKEQLKKTEDSSYEFQEFLKHVYFDLG